jgi:predicted SnoaL-like aldol condensation-catalyzing enzyme
MGKAPHQSSELENNKQLVRSFIEDVLTRHDIGAADKYFAQKPIKHNGQVMGTEGFKEARRRFFQEFPDSRTIIEHIVAEGNEVFAMLTTAAITNKQTGKRITVKSADLYRIEDGKIAENWDVADESGMT